MNREIQQKKVRQLRVDILKILYLRQSGHPGGSFSCVEILLAPHYNSAKTGPRSPQMAGRGRFVLSKGHACPALYVVLADRGFFPREDLWALRQHGSHLQGYPDTRKTVGTDYSTGSLGQGVSTVTGMIMATKHVKTDHRVCVFIGDSEM